MKKLTLIAALLCSISAFSTRYLVQAYSTNATSTWTRAAGTGETKVTLPSNNSLSAWYNVTINATLAAGDEVWLAGGTYSIGGALTLKSDISIYGSFAGTETDTTRTRVSGGKAWEFANQTILDGGATGDKSCFSTTASTGLAYIDGLKITRFQKTSSGTGVGGHLTNNWVIRNCNVNGNSFAGATNKTCNSAGISILGNGQLLNSYIYNNQNLQGTSSAEATSGGIYICGNSNTKIKGCTIEGNKATVNAGGIFLDKVTGNGGGGIIENCIIKNNQAITGAGGGIYAVSTILSDNIIIKTCTIQDNTAVTYGGGMSLNMTGNSKNISIEGCTFSGNTVTGAACYAAALNCVAGDFTTNPIKNCIFRDNSASATTNTSIGAIFNSAVIATMQNCLIANNTVTSASTSAVRFNITGSKVLNCTFAKNLMNGATSSGRALSLGSMGVIVTNCLFWGNYSANLTNTIPIGAINGTGADAPVITYNAQDGGTAPTGTGNITTLNSGTNNTFTSPTANGLQGANTSAQTKLDIAAANWSLMLGSPAINAGTDLSASIITDILGSPRPYPTSAFDIGAYESSYLSQTITFDALIAKTYGDATFDLTASASTGLSVTYTSSNTAVATVSGNTVTIVGAGSTNITATQAGNSTYNAASAIQALTVNKKTLTLTNPAATNKKYNGTNIAAITGTLTGIINSDAVTLTGTGTFADVNVANGIAVTSTSTLGGAKAGNYTLTQPTGLSANITAKALTMTGLSVPVSKIYDGLTTAVVTDNKALQTAEVYGTGSSTDGKPYTVDDVSITGTPVGTYNSKDVASASTVTYSGLSLAGAQAGNYTLTVQGNSSATITPATLTLTSAAATSKVYTGTNAAVITGTLTGIVNSEDVTLNGTGTFADVNVANGIAVTSTSTLGGAKAGNYTLTQPTGLSANITAKALTMTGLSVPVSKIYDGLTTAVVTDNKALQTAEVYGTGSSTDGKPYTVDDVSITGTPVGTYNSKDVASASTVTYSGLSLAGAQAGNYTLTVQGNSSATITPATLTLTSAAATSKVYTGTNAAVITGTLTGIVNSEDVTLNGTGTFADVNVANGIAVTSTSTLGGANAGNYTLTQPTGLTANITPASQTISFGSLPTGKIVGDADFAPGATSATSGTNAITYSSSNTNVATIVSGNIHIVGAGSTTITAHQAASTNYSAASSVDQNLTILAASVTVLADANLSTYSPTSTTDVTVSAGELTVDDNFSVKSMTVAPGAKLTLVSGKTLSVVGAFTLQSDATGTATFVNNGGTVSAASTNVEQYLITGRNWYISSPVSNGITATFNPAGGSNNLFWYDESKGSTSPWSYSTRNDSSLQVMRGYVANMASTGVVTFTGALNTEATITLHRTAGQVKEGFNLVGNPYPAHTTITKTITDAANALNTIWYRTATWDAVHSKYVYTFQTCLLYANGTYLGTPDTTTPIIAPMQAFWVRTSTNGSTLDFSTAAQSHQSANPLKAPASKNLSQEMLRLQVTNSDAIADETVLYFNSDASNSFDAFDAQKMFNNSTSVAEIYTVAGEEGLAINGLNAISYDTEMPLGFNAMVDGTFSIKASQIANFTPGTQVILKDYAYVNNPVITDLSDGNSYSFSSSATSNNTSRFTLIFRAPSVTTGINPGNYNNVWISSRNGQLVVNGTKNNKTMLEVFNAVGQKVISRNLTDSTIELESKLVSGAYLVRITFEGKSVTKKVIID